MKLRTNLFKICNCKWELVYHFDPKSKAQSMAWKHITYPPPRRFRVVSLACEVKATVFWDSEGIVLINCLEHGSTITGTYYADLTWKCWAAMKEKRRGKLCRGVLFHQNNAPAHTSSQAPSAIWTAPSLTVFTRPARPQWPLFVSKTERTHERIEICWWRRCCPHCKWQNNTCIPNVTKWDTGEKATIITYWDEQRDALTPVVDFAPFVAAVQH